MNSSESPIAESVERFGWHCISIDDIDPPFLYSIGLMTTFNHPEAINFGLNSKPVVEEKPSGSPAIRFLGQDRLGPL